MFNFVYFANDFFAQHIFGETGFLQTSQSFLQPVDSVVKLKGELENGSVVFFGQSRFGNQTVIEIRKEAERLLLE